MSGNYPVMGDGTPIFGEGSDWCINTYLHSVGEDKPTLRDQFAMAALTGMLSSGMVDLNARSTRVSAPGKAYLLADAMMEARGDG